MLNQLVVRWIQGRLAFGTHGNLQVAMALLALAVVWQKGMLTILLMCLLILMRGRGETHERDWSTKPCTLFKNMGLFQLSLLTAPTEVDVLKLHAICAMWAVLANENCQSLNMHQATLKPCCKMIVQHKGHASGQLLGPGRFFQCAHKVTGKSQYSTIAQCKACHM